MKSIIAPLKELEVYNNIVNKVKDGELPVYISGVTDSQKSHLAYGIDQAINKNRIKLVVTYNEMRAKTIIQDMKFFYGEDNVCLYPSKDVIFYNADVHSNDIIRERLKVLDKVFQNDDVTIVLSIEALLDPLIERKTFEDSIITCGVGRTIDIKKISKKLIYMGYERTDQVESRGQFAIRGGIIDIYTFNSENIYRIELFDDEVDSLRLVNSSTQRSFDNVDSIRILPAREIVVTDDSIDRAIKNIKKDRDELINRLEKKKKLEEANRIKNIATELLDRVSNTGNFNGIEGNVKYYFEKVFSLIDYLESPLIFIDEPNRIEERWTSIEKEFRESMSNRFEKGYLLKGQVDIIHGLDYVISKMQKNHTISFSNLLKKEGLLAYKYNVDLNVKSVNPYSNNIEILKKDLRQWIKDKYRIILLCGSKTRSERMVSLLNDNNIEAYYESGNSTNIPKAVVSVCSGSLSKGFEYSDINLVVVTESEIINKKKKKKKKRTDNKYNIESFTDLKAGDYIVHDNYGVGIFKGIEKIEIDGISKDFIKISYRDEGNLYITTNQLDVIQKYIGAEGRKPKLNKLGTTEWKRAKAKVKGAVEELAKDLIELYAKREVQKGYMFGEDTLWQKEFEEMFPYQETDDQLNAIEDTKKDMESSKIMDRLICGDVGYGKTEIAIRAAFKSVQDGKQVAYLVPTTILAQQHYKNFQRRMKDFPIRVEMLSRFKTAKEQKDIIEQSNAGLVDIIIGTHRLISKDVKFKDLGLLIIDEEQRFGVSHKEKIKKFKENIDVLTLTATPIPRTLHMSLIGIRDMSILEKPPEERYPIQTYVLEHNDELIKDAIYRELSRGGQIYYLYNRVSNISEIANNISKLVPEAKVAYAHGQMKERQLENIMFEFINGEIDILVSTTIIETGLDIQNANTMIIQDADRMGLSQLYQLRGRVGRSNRVAYAYLMYKRDKVLKEVAEKRLQAIKEFTEFGSGFKIALRDLEIRGAGNILGESQHGHMEAVGYDMYCKLLKKAVNHLMDEDFKEEFETTIDINVSAFIPERYIKNEIQKIEAYKKIASIEKQDDYFDVRDELIDRYGDLPKSVENLLEIAIIKSMANVLDIVAIQEKNNSIILEIKKDANLNPEKIPDLINEFNNKLKFTINDKPQFVLTISKEEKKRIFRYIKNLLQSINQLKY
jgi:transcription-repair coupling factor (superfamily II helicase)